MDVIRTIVLPKTATQAQLRAVFECGRGLRRQFAYDFVPFSADKLWYQEKPVDAFLFVSDDGTVAGAGSFERRRWVGHTDVLWALEWVWLRPQFRRVGVLSAAWQGFVDRYGVFPVVGPFSAEMDAFLRQRAPAHPRFRDGISETAPTSPLRALRFRRLAIAPKL